LSPQKERLLPTGQGTAKDMSDKSENRMCQNCKLNFTIEPDDFSFYEKIKVPPPTFCPECRMIRRTIWRNHRSLSKRNCLLCNKFLITMYSDSVPVLCAECFYGDNFIPEKYGKDYDFSRPFFAQLKDFFIFVPRLFSLRAGNLVNSDYTNYTKDNKNVYLSYSVSSSENVMYSENSDFLKNSVDNFAVKKSEGCYYNVGSDNNYNTYFVVLSNNCIDSSFVFDCINCSNCCLSYNIRNQKYVFNNQKLPKKEYEEKIKELKLETYSGQQEAIKKFDDLIENNAVHRYASIHHSENVISGDYISNSKNIKYCFNAYDSENISYSNRVLGVKDCMDCQGIGFGSELVYESVASTISAFKCSFSYLCINNCRDCEYSFILKNCQNCFGCVSLTNASYCIFNKQYPKKEYFMMVEKIKKQMNDIPYVDSKGREYRYGEFFPYDMCPFGYNETNTLDFFPISKEEAVSRGYFWKEKEKRDYGATMQSSNIEDSILNVKEGILDEIIECPNNGNQIYQCSTAYRIIQEELNFYRQKNIPLPRYCPNCRHYQRLKYYNPMKLWHRKCMKEGCTNEFETSYSPDRPEIIYCERCYQQEVY